MVTDNSRRHLVPRGGISLGEFNKPEFGINKTSLLDNSMDRLVRSFSKTAFDAALSIDGELHPSFKVCSLLRIGGVAD